MSDPRVAGLASALLVPLAEEAAAQTRRPPHLQRQARAGLGAFLFSWCATLEHVCGPHVSAPPVLHYAWWGCAALGTVLLLAGLFGRARGPLGLGALWGLTEAAGASWLLWRGIYPANLPLAAFMLHGLYLSVLCSALAQLIAAFLALPRGDAEMAVLQNMAAKNPPIIPVQRRTR